jgi:very-short-patch-repair endonuclease
MAAIARVAGRQFGVISLEQLQRIGLTAAEIRALVERGHLIRLHRRVFAVGHLSIVPHGHLVAALLTAGPEAFLSHRSSAAARGLRPINTRRIDLTIPGHKRRSRDQLILHHTAAIHPADVTTWNGLRVSSIARMLIELAPREKRQELDRLINECVRRDLLDLTTMEHALRRHARWPGCRSLKAALHGYRRDDTKSRLEFEFRTELARRPEIPEPETNVYLGPWEIDVLWRKQRFAVELDGRPYHIALQEVERDRRKDAWLQLRGLRILRITDTRWELDRAGVWDDVYAFLGLSRMSVSRMTTSSRTS